ncbi:SDR family NAD(P)-dependent oxidoreductase [Pseudoruegeria sp. SHC-113]|uniref:SDR family NAD(P)-dependent oxidoreductase n=1 Tax=Pseudoruegeria sp. SHC-113 TaxID=2855439 RepID=UPI0021BAC32B|nr:SDR family NAD(P)-dependent oxidoreductase [Pseudoruegeria sp. SHC-113]MCT8159481.1 SDR family NAD(P)-dependent oxidoreductase [Pseudoruegeria sp. SHC-113]
MKKTILITGATDGIGRATAQALAGDGHRPILHGRNAEKLAAVAAEVGGEVRTELADFADLSKVAALGRRVAEAHGPVDVLINNAGVLRTSQPRTASGEDVRFVVNTFAPALLSRLLLPALAPGARLVHLSSAAQAPVDLAALRGERPLEAMEAYAQSKLALTLWSQAFGQAHPEGLVSVAVNPGSLLATNMVREGFGMAGHDIGIGVGILTRAALSPEFATASGKYFDNDAGRFAAPQADASDPAKLRAVVEAIESRIAGYL